MNKQIYQYAPGKLPLSNYQGPELPETKLRNPVQELVGWEPTWSRLNAKLMQPEAAGKMC